MIDLTFAIVGQRIPADHGYPLYASLARLLPDVHRDNGIAIHPIRGLHVGDRMLQLCDWSQLVIRVSADRIASMVRLSGKNICLAGR